jgi:hydrogenase maturation protease
MMQKNSAHPEVKPEPILLLACGNTFRGDDGVGWCIGHTVRLHPPCSGLNVILTRQLLPEHAEAISAAEVVVFVDCDATTAPGAVSTLPIQPAETIPRTLTHHLDPASLLRLSRDLYARIPARALLVSVGGESFEWTDRLSSTVKAAIPKALEEVRSALLQSSQAAMPMCTAKMRPGAIPSTLC